MRERQPHGDLTWLAQLANEVAHEAAEPGEGQVSVGATCVGLAERLTVTGDVFCGDDGRDSATRSDLDALCRKLQVAKTTLARYGQGWKRQKGAPKLTAAAWRLLVGMLIAHADAANHQFGGLEPAHRDDAARDGFGQGLKSLNAALAGLQRAESEGVVDLDDLRQRAEAATATVAELTRRAA